MKRIPSLLFAVMFAWQTLAYDFKSGDLYYNITSDTTVEVAYEIYADKNNYSGLTNAVIPKTVTNNGVTYSVSGIGYCAFDYCSGLTSVTIPNSIKSIGGFAFAGCFGLTSLTIPNSVNTIGDGAFLDCDELTSIIIPNSVQTIGEYAFNDCDRLTKAEFYSIESLCKIKFADYDSNPLSCAKHLYINGVEVTEIVIPDSIKSIGSYAFYNCSGITSVTIGNSVTSVGNSAFTGCSSLTSVTIGNSVTNIGEEAISYCSGLKSVTIPSSVTSIGEWAFKGCIGLTEINVDIANTVYTSENGVLFNKDKTTIICYPEGKTDTAYTIPNSVSRINAGAFNNCSSLKSLTIPNSVTEISYMDCDNLEFLEYNTDAVYLNEYWFFNGILISVNSLKTLIIGNAVTYIDDESFQDCSKLTSVTIGNSVKKIGDIAFSGCISLNSVNIPNSVTSIGEYAFERVKNIVYSGSAEGSPWGAFNVNAIPDKDGFIYSDAEKTSLVAYVGNGKEITIPNSVEYIDQYAFYNCRSLTSVIIPNTVKIISYYAFGGCTATIYCEFESKPDDWSSYWCGEYEFEYEGEIVWKTATPITESTATAINIYVHGKTIVVENATEKIRVYDAMGRIVGRDVARNVSTIKINNPGVYIVKTGNVVKRVMVN